jgi:hypothetical protein
MEEAERMVLRLPPMPMMKFASHHKGTPAEKKDANEKPRRVVGGYLAAFVALAALAIVWAEV